MLNQLDMNTYSTSNHKICIAAPDLDNKSEHQVGAPEYRALVAEVRQLKNYMASVTEGAGSNNRHTQKHRGGGEYRPNKNHERKESKAYPVENRDIFNKQRVDAYKNQKEGKVSNPKDPMIQWFPAGQVQKIINILGKDKETATNVLLSMAPGLQNFFFVRYSNFLTSDLSNETRMSFFLMRQKNSLFAF